MVADNERKPEFDALREDLTIFCIRVHEGSSAPNTRRRVSELWPEMYAGFCRTDQYLKLMDGIKPGGLICIPVEYGFSPKKILLLGCMKNGNTDLGTFRECIRGAANFCRNSNLKGTVGYGLEAHGEADVNEKEALKIWSESFGTDGKYLLLKDIPDTDEV